MNHMKTVENFANVSAQAGVSLTDALVAQFWDIQPTLAVATLAFALGDALARFELMDPLHKDSDWCPEVWADAVNVAYGEMTKVYQRAPDHPDYPLVVQLRKDYDDQMEGLDQAGNFNSSKVPSDVSPQ